MNCREALELLGETLADDPGSPVGWRLKLHLWCCRHCRHIFVVSNDDSIGTGGFPRPSGRISHGPRRPGCRDHGPDAQSALFTGRKVTVMVTPILTREQMLRVCGQARGWVQPEECVWLFETASRIRSGGTWVEVGYGRRIAAGSFVGGRVDLVLVRGASVRRYRGFTAPSVTSTGRASLPATLASIQTQRLLEGDEMLLVHDGQAGVQSIIAWAIVGRPGLKQSTIASRIGTLIPPTAIRRAIPNSRSACLKRIGVIGRWPQRPKSVRSPVRTKAS